MYIRSKTPLAGGTSGGLPHQVGDQARVRAQASTARACQEAWRVDKAVGSLMLAAESKFLTSLLVETGKKTFL